MEPDEIIKLFSSFLEGNHLSNILENERKGLDYVYIPFNDISIFNPDLGLHLLDYPEETLKIFSVAIGEQGVERNIHVRIIGLPLSCDIPIWEIREPSNKFIRFEGYVSKLGSILLRPSYLICECEICGLRKTILTKDRTSKPIINKKCGCGGKLIKKHIGTINTRIIYVEEDIMELRKRQIPREKMIVLEHDLTAPEMDKETLIGRRVVINGWLESYVVTENNKVMAGAMDTLVICNSIEFVERGWDAIKLTEREKQKCIEIAKREDLISLLSQSIMSTVHKEDEVKHGLLLQLAGANNIYDEKGFLEERGCIHISLIGPPGVAKTYMIKRIKKFWPIYRFSSAVTATGRGLIAAVVHDKVLEKWVLVAGVIPTCHLGLVGLDELEKMNKDEYGFLNNAMNDLEVVISKVASGKLDTDVAILATMNPRGRIFIEGTPIYEQIELPADLIDRFDLIFPIKATVKEEDQREIFRISVRKRKKSTEIMPELPEEFLIKYFAYARTLKPKIPEEMEKIIEDRVMKFVRVNPSEERLERNISNRIFGVILRLVESSARLHLRDQITISDLNDIMDLLVYSYKMQGFLNSDNVLDYDKMEHIDSGMANAVPLIKEKLAELENIMKPVPIEDLITAIDGKVPTDKIDEAIEKMKFGGELMEPRRGFIQRI